MQPVESLIRRSNQSPDDVALSSKQEHQRELDHCDETCPIANVFERPPVLGVQLVEAEDDQYHRIRYDKCSSSNGWEEIFAARGSYGAGGIIGHFAKDRGDGG